MSLPQLAENPRAKKLVRQIGNKHDLSWKGVTYSRVLPGIYDAICSGFQGPEWLRARYRWSIRIEFALLGEDANVSRFFNMGSDPKKPHIGRNSLYFKWWTAANGELPTRGQNMSPDIFLDGQVFRVGVEDAGIDGEQQQKQDAEIYSRVVSLHGVNRPKSSNLSIVQSGIIYSPNQAINQSSRPPGVARAKA